MFPITSWSGAITVALALYILIKLAFATNGVNAGQWAELKRQTVVLLVYGTCSGVAHAVIALCGQEISMASRDNWILVSAGVLGVMVFSRYRQSVYSSAEPFGDNKYRYCFSFKLYRPNPERIFLCHEPLRVSYHPNKGDAACIDCEISFIEHDLIRLYEGLKPWYMFSGTSKYVDYRRSGWLGLKEKCTLVLEQYNDLWLVGAELDKNLPKKISLSMQEYLESKGIHVTPYISLRRMLAGEWNGNWITHQVIIP